MSIFRRRTESPAFYKFFANVLGYTPRNCELYHEAFTHKSSSTVQHGHRVNNERLEYLGDAILSAVVAEFLYKKYPYQGEGYLTVMRSKIVSRASLNQLARKIGLAELIDYHHDPSSVYKSMGGDAFEALVGAMYLEKGYKFTRKVLIKKVLLTYLDIDAISEADWNYKSKIIDWAQKNRKKISFEVLRTFGQSHAARRQYESQVLIDGVPQKSAIDYSIKAAEQLAAEKTYKHLVETGVISPAVSS